MKKLLMITAIAVLGFTANAQDDTPTFDFYEGNIFLEGNLGFNSTNDKNTEIKTNAFSINPKAGYLIDDKLAVGIQLNYISSGAEISGTDTQDLSTVGAGVFARYYFLDLGQRFKTYTELGVSFATGKDNITDVKVNGIGAGVNLGLNYFVKENIAITFGLSDILSYSSTKVDADGAEAVTAFNANLNVLDNFFQTAQFGLLFKF